MIFKTLLGAAAAIAIGSAASAATLQITEGLRPQVAGTTAVADPGLTPIDLGTVTTADTAVVYGSLFGGTDVFSFVSDTVFTIDFLFGGYAFEDTGANPTPRTVSGLVQAAPSSPGEADKMVRFELQQSLGASFTQVADETLTANITAPTAPISSIFDRTFGPGTYLLNVFGQGTPRGVEFDIDIAAFTESPTAPIPLPASALLLVGAVGGLGFAARRKKA